ncbi:regulator of telomere elongation helicase 1 homolog [Diorhabda sublineata]|uniref:regulator of telomere elongation helicase 1 homolog n=1 Tax=Diorhabda sublineata TaxID=1163346 RepID=UPI0024E11EEF|nr:regulator of telomere elongation helicase 1 homolog [Diorhabda sublineata]XP_056648959.1 regulator of telomere elongation helicase 1 homolog [Diorhabda sublineata]
MTTVTIRGVPVSFPFEPYAIQTEYMEKVLECLQNETNGVLESPTGTGKTLSLLCSTLAWLELKKIQIKAQRTVTNNDNDFLATINNKLNDAVGKQVNSRTLSGIPVVIYASRTHTQLTQAMKEMKRTAYGHMKAVVLGSRDQLCIHPEIEKENNRNFKVMMCRLKVKTRSCKFYNKVEQNKLNSNVSTINIMDIEDLVKIGKCNGFCPFYMAKELKEDSDVIFMPYNYLLDPSIRKTLGIDLTNTVVILDEAHNVERICEESASLQIKSSDVALAIEEVTAIMKMLSMETIQFEDTPKDFDANDLCNLKETFLNFEKEIDAIDLKSGLSEGLTLDGTFLFELLEKAGIRNDNYFMVQRLISQVVQFLATLNEGPFARRGNGLQIFEEMLTVVFSDISHDFRQKVKKCYKVFIQEEQVKKKSPDNWLSKMVSTKAGGKILNYWCFSPGFGMNMLVRSGLRTLILTSGTLAPLNPLISELELNVTVRLENPHIISDDQFCVKIIPTGPDSIPLNSSFQNRDNPRYINSLGMAILNISRMVPDGMLIFFPSYPTMLKCQQIWQESGIWSSLNNQKAIFVEPREKNSFNSAMSEYYSKIKDPTNKGAIFIGVCRGKVSEGLDFVDANGRAVLITGLPYPPFKDPKVVLKKEYLNRCNVEDKAFLKGQDWYNLEATRAVNQAIGRVIRHKDDYGAILLLDSRFNNPVLKNHMSLWIRNSIKVSRNFGELMKDLRSFFKAADAKYKGVLEEKSLTPLSAEFGGPSSYKINEDTSNAGEVIIHSKKTKELTGNPSKKIKLSVVPNSSKESKSSNQSDLTKDYIVMVRKRLDDSSFKDFVEAIKNYKACDSISSLISQLDNVFKNKCHLKYLIPGLESYIKTDHKLDFSKYCQDNGLLDV